MQTKEPVEKHKKLRSLQVFYNQQRSLQNRDWAYSPVVQLQQEQFSLTMI